MYEITHLPSIIEIGTTGESNFRTFTFDMRPWLVNVPDGVASIVLIRPGESADDAYIASTTFDDGILTWTPAAADLGLVEGYGIMEIWLEETENNSLNKRGKSARVQTFVRQSMAQESQELPEPQETWLEQMTSLKTQTVSAAIDAEDAKDDAVAAKEAAEQAASDLAAAVTAAEGSATAAAGSATSASGSATAAAGSATAAAGSATAAETAQGKAEDAQEAAETAQAEAWDARMEAYNSSVDAQESAELAAQHAQSAHEAVTYYPKIENGTWWVYDATQEAWVNTNVSATGPQGAKGDTGSQGPVGPTGPAGSTGEDGFSPTVTVQEGGSGSDTGHFVKITDAEGDHLFFVPNGRAGISPSITVTEITGGHRVSYVSATGPTQVDIMDGEKGDQGDPGDPTELIDDTDTDTDLTWSSAKIAEELESKAVIIKPTVGPADIATFADGADDLPLEQLIVAVAPAQDLHGYDKPWIGGAGKNKFDISGFETVTNKGITVTQNNDGSVSVSGTATARATISLGNITISGTVILTGCPAGGSSSGYSLDIRRNGSTISGSTDTGSGSSAVAVEPDDTVFLRVENGYAFASTLVFRPMIRLSTVSDATWEPYENLCPITGWDGVEVTRKNLPIIFDSVGAVADTDYVNGKAYDVNTGAINTTQGYMIFTAYVKCVPGETYYLSGNKSATQSRGVYVSYYDANKNFLSSANPIENTSSTGIIRGSFTVPTGVAYMRFTTPTLVADTFFVSDGVEIPADYSYVGQTYPITFPTSAGTVYGCTLTINRDGSGSLVVDKVTKEIPTITAFSTSGDYGNGAYVDFTETLESGQAKVIAISDVVEGRAFNNRTNFCCAKSSSNSKRMIVYTNADYTVEQYNANIAGGHLVANLATPVSYSLTANQVRTLLGYNAIWADAGQVSVTYPADTKRYIDNKLAELVAQIVNS